jgi:uncharacterized membrane protein (UPF0127 family)
MRRARARGLLGAVLLLTFATACRADPRVIITTADGRDLAVSVEIADTPAKREFGLQYRRELAPDRGMIFLFPRESMLSFWMKNTPLPLDMIFIGHDLRIVGIVADTTPFSLDARSVSAPSRFVLEVNAGYSRRHGIKPGDRVRFENFSPDHVNE